MEVAISTDYFVCASCQVECETSEEYKKHYATKFHQYNVKRKLIDLPPITLEQYDQRFNEFVKKQNEENESIQSVSATNRCSACSKTFANTKSFESHLKSKKHIENQKKYQERSQLTETASQLTKNTSENKVRVPTNKDQRVCLFCDQKCKSVEINLEHMKKKHGFFVVEKKYASDVEGLLKYLGEKINNGNMCIQCENKGCKDFKSGEAVQAHMIDKGHCFMNTEKFEEYHKYYDFTLKKKEEEEQKDLEEGNDEDFENGDEEDWEDESDEEEEKEEEIDIDKIRDSDLSSDDMDSDEEEKMSETDKKIKREKKIQRYLFRQQYKKFNSNRMANIQFMENGELELDNGKIIGHRQYKRYYRMFYRFRADPFRNMRAILGPEAAKSRELMIKQKNYQIALSNRYNKQVAIKEQEKFTHKKIQWGKRHNLKVQLNNNQTTMHHYKNQNPL